MWIQRQRVEIKYLTLTLETSFKEALRESIDLNICHLIVKSRKTILWPKVSGGFCCRRTRMVVMTWCLCGELCSYDHDHDHDLMLMWRMIPPWQLSPFPTCAWRFTKPPQNRGLHSKCVSIDFLQPTCKCGPSLRPSGELDGEDYDHILWHRYLKG